MISPNPTSDLPPDSLNSSGSAQTSPAAGVVNSSASMEGTENPESIKTPESPRKDSSTTVQNTRDTSAPVATTSANPMIRRNPTSDSSPDLVNSSGSAQTPSAAGVVNSSNASMETTENPDSIKTPESPHKSTMVQNTLVTGKTDLSNHNNASTATTSADPIISFNPKPDLSSGLVDSVGPAQKSPAAEVVNSSDASMKATENPDRNQTPDSPRKGSSTTTQKPPVPENTNLSNHTDNTSVSIGEEQNDSSNHTNALVQSPMTAYNPTPPEQKGTSNPVPPAAGMTSAANIDKELVDPDKHVNPTPGSSGPLKSKPSDEKLNPDSQNSTPFDTGFTPMEEVLHLSSSSNNFDNPGAGGQFDSHRTVDTATAETLPTQPNNPLGNDKTGFWHRKRLSAIPGPWRKNSAPSITNHMGRKSTKGQSS